MTRTDVVIIGAGPYGISTAAHLQTIPGIEVRVFGEPMSFWERNMPKGMLLRSNWTATQIAHPRNEFTLEAYIAACGNHLSQPVPLERFIQYGKWYQENAVPGVDRRKVARIASERGGFQVTLEDGEVVQSGRVIVAAGIGLFAWVPPEFRRLPSALVSHASEHNDLSRFAGKQVLVIGGGQSALESAALLHEAGASVEVIARSTKIHWLQGALSKTLHHRLGGSVRSLLYAPTDVGPAGLSQLLARPDLVRLLPRRLQNKLRKRAVRPAGARWLVRRLERVPIRLGRLAISAKSAGEQVHVQLDNQEERAVDHVLFGTGYRVDITLYKFLAPNLIESIRRVGGYPVLNEGLETSVPGLHILGSPAAWSFGPLLQFVSGAGYASRSVLRHVSKSRST